MKQPDPLWPFRGPLYDTPRGQFQTYYVTASDRIDVIGRMTDPNQLIAAASVPELQKSVASAIRRRLKQLEAACH